LSNGTGGIGLPVLAVLPLLPAAASLLTVLLAGLAGAVAGAATLKPAAVKKLGRALLRQYRGLVALAVLGALVVLAIQASGGSRAGSAVGMSPQGAASARWPEFRGSPGRSGHADSHPGPTRGGIRWTNSRDLQFFSSPAVVGETVVAVGSRGDSARFLCWDVSSGEEIWNIAPRGHRATFSSPVIDRGWLVCGEGYHDTANSCLAGLDLRQVPAPAFRFPTASHIECTPVISAGRVYFTAGDDGVYCIELPDETRRETRLIWHAAGDKFPDAETALIVRGGRVFVGLGYGGQALCVLDAESGHEIARLALPYPVFSPPASEGNHLYLGMGPADYGRHPDAGPGEVRCVDLDSLQTLWTLATPATVLSAVVADGGDVIFSTVAGQVFVVTSDGRISRTWDARSRMLSAPAVTPQMVYCVSCDGLLTGLERRRLEPIWTLRLGEPGDYISAPVVCRGQVLVGTPADGFICAGEPAGQTADEIWHGPLGGPGRTGATDDSPIPREVVTAWTLSGHSIGPQADVSAPPAVTKDEIVVPWASATWSGLACYDQVDAGTPRRRWTWKCSDRIEVSPAISGNTVVCLSGARGRTGQLVAIDRQTGELAWNRTIDHVGNSLFVDFDAAYTPSDSGRLTRFSLSGQRQWDVDVGQLRYPVHVAQGIVVAASTLPDQLTALDRETGATLWKAGLSAAPADSPVIIQDNIFLATAKSIESHSLVDGALRTTFDGGPTSGPAFIDRDRIIHVARDGNLVFASPLAHTVRRRLPGVKPGTAPLVGSDAVVFVAADDSFAWLALDGTSRPQAWFATGDAKQMITSLLLRDGQVYVGVAGVGLVCLEARSQT